MENYVEIMEKIGLTEKESKVYITLLKLGKSSASQIAKNSGLKRPTVYLVIEDLRKNGYVLKTPGDKKQMFFAKSPEEIIYSAKRNVENAINVLPKLMGIFNKDEGSVKTLQFDGVEGIKKALMYKIDELKGKEILAFFGGSEDASEELNSVFHNWNSLVYKKGINIRSIVPDNSSLRKYREDDQKFGFKNKILDKNCYNSKTSIEITENFIRVIMFKEEQAVIIENRVVSNALKEIFEITWKNS